MPTAGWIEVVRVLRLSAAVLALFRVSRRRFLPYVSSHARVITEKPRPTPSGSVGFSRFPSESIAWSLKRTTLTERVSNRASQKKKKKKKTVHKSGASRRIVLKIELFPNTHFRYKRLKYNRLFPSNSVRKIHWDRTRCPAKPWRACTSVCRTVFILITTFPPACAVIKSKLILRFTPLVAYRFIKKKNVCYTLLSRDRRHNVAKDHSI